MHPLMSPMTKLPFDFSPAYSNGKGGGVICEFLGGGVQMGPRGGSRGRVQGVPTPPEMTGSFLIQLVFCKKKKMWFIGVEAEQEKSAPPPKKNPGSAPDVCSDL